MQSWVVVVLMLVCCNPQAHGRNCDAAGTSGLFGPNALSLLQVNGHVRKSGGAPDRNGKGALPHLLELHSTNASINGGCPPGTFVFANGVHCCKHQKNKKGQAIKYWSTGCENDDFVDCPLGHVHGSCTDPADPDGSHMRKHEARDAEMYHVQKKLNFSTVHWPSSEELMRNDTGGCTCYFDETRTDCACCKASGCQCGEKHKSKCAPCKAMWRCEVDDDGSDGSQLPVKLGLEVLSSLLVILEADTYETRQAGIRDYLRRAYHLKTSKEKIEAIALLDSRLNEQKVDRVEPIFAFPDENEVEEWLTNMFLEEDLFSQTSTKSLLGLRSRPELLQIASSCDWHAALNAFYSSGGVYGNWCGANEWENNTSVSAGSCRDAKAQPSKFKVEVCKDSGFDEACSRHDQGTYGESVYQIATKSLCKVDGDFAEARKALKVSSHSKDAKGRSEAQAAKAASCLFNMMPCLRYESKSYWTWCPSWSGGYPCKRTAVGYFTHFPFGNYSFQDDACGPTGCYQVEPDEFFALPSPSPSTDAPVVHPY